MCYLLLGLITFFIFYTYALVPLFIFIDRFYDHGRNMAIISVKAYFKKYGPKALYKQFKDQWNK